MSPRWTQLLATLGRPFLSQAPAMGKTEVSVDLGGGMSIRTSCEELSSLMGPPPGSPWLPYHCPTLFAVLRSKQGWMFGPPLEVPPWIDQPPPGHPLTWLTPDTVVFLELAGPACVFAAASLRLHCDVQTVCTFDNWPDLREVNPASDVLQACLRVVGPLRERRPSEGADAVPVWVCDRDRMAGADPLPGRYDNRYYIDDSLLPGAQTFLAAGTRNVVWVTDAPDERPLPDLANLFAELAAAGIALWRVFVTDTNQWRRPVPLPAPAPEPLPLRTFTRSDIGGFGVVVPEVVDYSGAAAGAAFHSTSYRGG